MTKLFHGTTETAAEAIRMKQIEPNTFAEACCDQNSIAELEVALAGEPDLIDMRTWGLSATAWREQIELALTAKKENP